MSTTEFLALEPIVALIRVLASWSFSAIVLLTVVWAVPERFARVRHDMLLAGLLALPLAMLIPVGVGLGVGMGPPGLLVAAPRTTLDVVLAPNFVEWMQSLPWPILGIMTAWLAGGAIQLIEVWGSARRLKGIIRRSVPLSSEMVKELPAGRYVVRVSQEIPVPIVCGVLRPKILLPFSSRDLLLAVRHEIAHLNSGDVVASWVALTIRVVAWPIPMVWLMSHFAASEREVACDASAVQPGEEYDYAVLLRRFALPNHQPSLSMASTGRLLVRRVNLLRCRELRVLRASRFISPVLLVLVLVLVGSTVDIGRGTGRGFTVDFSGDATLSQIEEALLGAGIGREVWNRQVPFPSEGWQGEIPTRRALRVAGALVTAAFDDSSVAARLRAIPDVAEVSLMPWSSTCGMDGGTPKWFARVRMPPGILWELAQVRVSDALSDDGRICSSHMFSSQLALGDIPTHEWKRLESALGQSPFVVRIGGRMPVPQEREPGPDGLQLRYQAAGGYRLAVPNNWKLSYSEPGTWSMSSPGGLVEVLGSLSVGGFPQPVLVPNRLQPAVREYPTARAQPGITSRLSRQGSDGLGSFTVKSGRCQLDIWIAGEYRPTQLYSTTTIPHLAGLWLQDAISSCR